MKRIILDYVLTIQYITFQLTETSIVGVTYMDEFDFEDRYTNMNECNPYYWHPLHLPEECLDVFDKFIRTGLKSSIPYSIVRDKQDFDEPSYDTSPFHMLFELLRRDINDLPRAPRKAILPNLGMVELYRQPVSYKTVSMIEKLARAYSLETRDLTSRHEIWPRPRIYDYDAFQKNEKKKEINKKASRTIDNELQNNNFEDAYGLPGINKLI